MNFIILLVLLYFFACKPLMRMLDERSRRVKESMEQAEQVKMESEQADEQIQKRLEEAGKEGQEMVARAVKFGEELKGKARGEAKIEAEKLIAKARNEIEKERDEAIGELREEFADLTIIAAQKVIDRSLDKKAHREIIDKVIKESKTLKKG
jgi:F-type H+-transporting ATPase subunit b